MRLIGSRPGQLAAVGVALLSLAGCSRSGYQYLENDDAHVFAKLPSDWTVISDSIVNPSLVPSAEASYTGLPGDDTLPWRAEFTHDDEGRILVGRPSGYFGVQPVDARLRDELDVGSLLPFDPADTDSGFEIADRRDVTSGELHGLRMTIQSTDDDYVLDRLVLTDDSSSVVYVVQVQCSRACIDDHQDVIDEMMQTFTVERS